MEPGCLSPKTYFERANQTTYIKISRAGNTVCTVCQHDIVEFNTHTINLGTNESGIDVNQAAKSGATRQQLPSVGNHTKALYFMIIMHIIVLYRFVRDGQ